MMVMMMVVVALKAAILDLTAGTVVKATTTTTTAITGNSNNSNNENLKPKKSCLRRSRRLRDFYDSSLKHTHLFCGHTFLGEQQQAAQKQVTLWALDVCSLLLFCAVAELVIHSL